MLDDKDKSDKKCEPISVRSLKELFESWTPLTEDDAMPVIEDPSPALFKSHG